MQSILEKVKDKVSIKNNWKLAEVMALFNKPLFELVSQAHSIHQETFADNQIQASSLLSIKTGSCPEDCKYCPQSGHYNTDIEKSKLLDKKEVIESAKAAKENGATRFCMGAAWRSPPKKDFPKIIEMVEEVKAMGMETCLTLGMLDDEQVKDLKEAGLDYYNHNIDTSPDYYKHIISTRTFQDRIDTLEKVRNADINVCSGGIIGMGEKTEDRAAMLQTLANLEKHPESVPINNLIAIPNTPLEGQTPVENFDFIKTIAVARILMPYSYVRLSAGRENMSEEMQAWCFYAGANSMFYGEKLLTAKNPQIEQDKQLLKKLNLQLAN